MLFLAKCTALLFSLILPLAAAVFCCVRIRGGWKCVLYGAVTFLLFQGLLRIPIMTLVLPNFAWYLYLGSAQPVLNALFLAGTAALFEEGGRYLIMGLMMRPRVGARQATAFGIGHGGVEAVLLVGVNTLFMLLMHGNQMSSGMLFASGFERLFAMTCHVAFSLLVAAAVRRRNPLFALAAFLLHFLLDFPVALLPALGYGVFAIEATIGVFAAALVPVIVIALRRERRAAAEGDAKSVMQEAQAEAETAQTKPE